MVPAALHVGDRVSGATPTCWIQEQWLAVLQRREILGFVVCRVISYWCMHRWGLWLVFLSDRELWQKLSMSVIDVDRAV